MEDVRDRVRLHELIMDRVFEVWVNSKGDVSLFHNTHDPEYVGGYWGGLDPFMVSRDKLTKFYNMEWVCYL